MLNAKQREWLCNKCDSMLVTADDYDLTDEQAEIICEMFNKYYRQSKGNPEVKEALLATFNYIDKMNRIMRGNNNA